jgi:hypothetical protein
MAEVRINISAEDRATPVITSAVERIRGSLGVVKEQLASLDPLFQKSLNLDIADALEAVDRVKGALASIPDITTKTVVVEYQTKASPVMSFTEGIAHIREKMESLPDGQDYLINFQGLSQEAFGSLVTSAYDARMNAVSAKYKRGIGYNPLNYMHARERAREAERFLLRASAPRAVPVAGGGGGGTTNVTVRVEGGINIHGAENPADLAVGIDHELAVRVRNNRSELRVAMQGALGLG